MSALWSHRSMFLAEREKRVLVTLIEGHLALVVPKSLMQNVKTDEDMAALIARVASSLDGAFTR